MKKLVFAFSIMLLAAISLQAQTEYRVDLLTDSSLYLVEVTTPAPDSTGKVGQKTEFPLKFKDFAALAVFLEKLKAEAVNIRLEAEKRAVVFDSAHAKISALLPKGSPKKFHKVVPGNHHKMRMLLKGNKASG